MVTNIQRRARDPLWVYAYEIAPAQPSKRLDRIRALLEGENLAAMSGPGAWAGRLILEKAITYILIVSDTPARDREINGRLEAELERLKAAFSITDALQVATAPTLTVMPTMSGGNGKPHTSC